MATLTLPPELVERLDAVARQEQRTVESFIASLLQEHSAHMPEQDSSNDHEKREAVLKRDRLSLYEVERRYWRGVGDPRQNMTDDELEADFWLIDQDGIPCLKSERNTFDVPEHPLQTILDAIT